MSVWQKRYWGVTGAISGVTWRYLWSRHALFGKSGAWLLLVREGGYQAYDPRYRNEAH
jgi:hypothetical protein